MAVFNNQFFIILDVDQQISKFALPIGSHLTENRRTE